MHSSIRTTSNRITNLLMKKVTSGQIITIYCTHKARKKRISKRIGKNIFNITYIEARTSIKIGKRMENSIKITNYIFCVWLCVWTCVTNEMWSKWWSMKPFWISFEFTKNGKKKWQTYECVASTLVLSPGNVNAINSENPEKCNVRFFVVLFGN